MTALCYASLPELKSELSIDPGDTDDDTRLLRAIEDASRVIDRLCGRKPGEFAARTLTLYFDVPSTADVLQPETADRLVDERVWDTSRLYVPPLLSITTLKTDDDGDGTFETTWATTDYVLYPLNAITLGEAYREIHVNEVTGDYTFPAGKRRVQIVGSWAESSAVERPIRRATLLLATRYWKRPESPLGVLGTVDLGFQRLMQSDPDVAYILDQGGYRARWGLV